MRRGAVYCLGKKISISQVVRGTSECVINLQVSLKKVIELEMEIEAKVETEMEMTEMEAKNTHT